nr:uncharacterized mitochondrial protein AtMg00810-like [Tanacetum cinerariifolium]
MAAKLIAASANECLFLDFLSEIKPKNEFRDYVCKLDKALYGLKQAPKARSLVKASMVPPNNLGPDLTGKSVNETSYKGMIGSLILKESHLTDVKRILKYLKGTLTLGLYYPKCLGFNLKGYSDLDHAGCNKDRKSTPGACQILDGKLVCWSAKKQQSVAMSSAEAEYVVAAGCCVMVYQNFLMVFWSIALSFDLFPSTDEPNKCPLKEFLIKFSALNGQRPLTLDFKPSIHQMALIIIMASRALSKKSKKPRSKNQPLKPRDITSMTPDKGTAKTTSRPEGSRGDKYSGETNHPLIWNHSIPLMLISQGLVLSTNRTRPSPLDQGSMGKHKEAAVHYVNLKAYIDDYFNENIAHRDQIDKLVEASMSSLEKSSIAINDLYKGLEVITQLLKDITKSIKDDPATNKKIEKATKTLAKISTQTSQSSSAPSSSVTPTFTLIDTLVNVKDANIKVIAPLIHLQLLRHNPSQSSILNLLSHKEREKDKEEEIKKSEEEARLNALSKIKVIKVVRKEAKKLGIHPKEAITIKASELFKKSQDAEYEVLKRQHTEKVRKSLELEKHKGTDGRNFDVHKPFLFGAFGISELDELWEIIPKKKNAVLKDLMNSLSRRLECNRALPENVMFVNNMVIEEPEYGIFFTDEFGDQAFQRWSDIDKVGMEALVSYLVVASLSSLLKL